MYTKENEKTRGLCVHDKNKPFIEMNVTVLG